MKFIMEGILTSCVTVNFSEKRELDIERLPYDVLSY
jgi:hypothetical protein